jgi:hypothetical protein
MSTYKTVNISNERVETRWYEPYTSASSNRKLNAVAPTGRYRGFIVEAVAGEKKLNVLTDPTNGDSVAVYEKSGWSQTIRETSAIEVDGTMVPTGSDIIVALVMRVVYNIDVQTTASMLLIDEADIVSTDLVLAKVSILAGSADFDTATIYQDEVNSTRPWATGTKYGFIPAKYISEPTMELITLSVASTKFQLNRSIHIGKIGTDSQDIKDKNVVLFDANGEVSLFGDDGKPIYISKVNNSADTAEVNPSTDADVDGFYSNPWIYLDFSETSNVNYTGNLQIYYGKKSYYSGAQTDLFTRGASQSARMPTATGLHRGLLPAKHIAEPSRVPVTLGIASTKFQLPRKVYIGKSGSDSQIIKDVRFKLLDTDGSDVLTGSDSGPITILKINNSADTAEVDPSADADSDGFYENPWIYFDFSETSDTSFTGTFNLWCGVESFYSGFAPGAFTEYRPERDTIARDRIQGIKDAVGNTIGAHVIEYPGFTFNDALSRVEWASTFKLMTNTGTVLSKSAGYHEILGANQNRVMLMNAATGEFTDIDATLGFDESYVPLAFFYYNTTLSQFDMSHDVVRTAEDRFKTIEITVSDSGPSDFYGSGCLNRAVSHIATILNHSQRDIINAKIKVIGDITLADPVDFNDVGFSGLARVSIEGFLLNNLTNDLPRIKWSFDSGNAFLCTGSEKNVFKNLKFEYSGSVSTYSAIKDPGHGSVIENCTFESGGELYYSISGSGNDVIARDCSLVNQVYGIYLTGIRCRIENVVAIGDATPAYATAEGLRTDGNYSLITGCYVDDFGGEGIFAGNLSSIENCASLNAGLRGIIVGAYSTIENCYASGNGGDSLLLLNGEESAAIGNYLLNSNADGITMSGIRGRCVGNIVDSAGTIAVHVGADSCLVSSNNINGGARGIEIDDYTTELVEMVNVINNIIDTVTEYGIYDNGARFSRYAGNIIYEPGYDGFYVSIGGTKSLVFSENIIWDPGVGYDGFSCDANFEADSVTISKNVMQKSAADGAGIRLATTAINPTPSVIEGNWISNFVTGIGAEKVVGSIVGNYVYSQGNSIETGESCAVTGNNVEVTGNGFNGIFARELSSILGNRIKASANSNGILIETNSTDVAITGNSILGSLAGINVPSLAHRCSMIGNVIRGTEEYGIVAASDNCVITGNNLVSVASGAGAHDAIRSVGEKSIIIGNNINSYAGSGNGIAIGSANVYVVRGNNLGGSGTDALLARFDGHTVTDPILTLDRTNCYIDLEIDGGGHNDIDVTGDLGAGGSYALSAIASNINTAIGSTVCFVDGTKLIFKAPREIKFTKPSNVQLEGHTVTDPILTLDATHYNINLDVDGNSVNDIDVTGDSGAGGSYALSAVAGNINTAMGSTVCYVNGLKLLFKGSSSIKFTAPSANDCTNFLLGLDESAYPHVSVTINDCLDSLLGLDKESHPHVFIQSENIDES